MLERELRALARLGKGQHACDPEQCERAEEDLAHAREWNTDAENQLAVVPVELTDEPAEAAQPEQQPRPAPRPLDSTRRAQASPRGAGGRQRPGDVVDPDRSPNFR